MSVLERVQGAMGRGTSKMGWAVSPSSRMWQVGELKRLAAEMIPVFQSRDDHQKVLAAFLLFQKGCRGRAGHARTSSGGRVVP